MIKEYINKSLLSTPLVLAMYPSLAVNPNHTLTITSHPNIILIFVDDMGYGDLGCYGNDVHRTPNIDNMAEAGIRLTDFYVTSPVCTPSRASLLTGCYPQRIDMHCDTKDRPVLFPGAKKGLNPNEVTIAEILKEQGYATACIGKWHLGDQKPFLPTNQGFDYYYGIPYSNDMSPKPWDTNRPPIPLLKNTKVIEAPVEQRTITKRYTREAIRFIKIHKDKPFFLYLPHTMVHAPLHASEIFTGRSGNGKYGDAVEEIDWSTGKILNLLKELAIDQNTMVIFTSDNGADRHHGGSNKPLHGYKTETWEGGLREPCIIKYPGTIPAGITSNRLITNMDILPTIAALTDAELPNQTIDGYNVLEILKGNEDARIPRKYFAYYLKGQLQAIRSGKWKMHVPNRSKYATPRGDSTFVFEGKLYDLEKDIGEITNVWDDHPEVVRQMLKYAEDAREKLGDKDTISVHQRKAGYIKKPVFLEIKNN